MKRRAFMFVLGGAIAVPRAGRAQQKAMPVVGVLGAASPTVPFVAAGLAAWRQGLRDTGYVEGQNVAIEYRWAEGRYDRLPGLAAELVSRKVDLIISDGSTPTALAAKSATSTIPIVFTNVSDPVGIGLVASLARPGGNLTGVTDLTAELTPKRLELLSELVPEAKVIALLVNPNQPAHAGLAKEAQEAARTKGVELPILKAANESEIDAAFGTLAQLHARALLVAGDHFFSSRYEKLAAQASRHAIPAVYQGRSFVEAGGLVSFGPNFAAIARQAGIYAGRILKGEKPADLPVQQPTRFELVINLETAKALGLTVPQSLLLRADEVIE